jgi:hypothetical protein
MRRGLLTADQKSKLNSLKAQIMKDTEVMNFATELSVFLPRNQQDIIRDFKSNLLNELNRQLGWL